MYVHLNQANGKRMLRCPDCGTLNTNSLGHICDNCVANKYRPKKLWCDTHGAHSGECLGCTEEIRREKLDWPMGMPSKQCDLIDVRKALRAAFLAGRRS